MPPDIMLDRKTFSSEIKLNSLAAADSWQKFNNTAPNQVIERVAVTATGYNVIDNISDFLAQQPQNLV